MSSTDTPSSTDAGAPSGADAAPAFGTDSGADHWPVNPHSLPLPNQVAADSAWRGEFTVRGGLLLAGTLTGHGEIDGPLVVTATGQLVGHYRVLGDVYLLGQLGTGDASDAEHTTLECQGTVHLGSQSVSGAALFASRLVMQAGATLAGPFRTLPRGQGLPVVAPAA